LRKTIAKAEVKMPKISARLPKKSTPEKTSKWTIKGPEIFPIFKKVIIEAKIKIKKLKLKIARRYLS